VLAFSQLMLYCVAGYQCVGSSQVWWKVAAALLPMLLPLDAILSLVALCNSEHREMIFVRMLKALDRFRRGVSGL
jgi:hypothetical protein